MKAERGPAEARNGIEKEELEEAARNTGKDRHGKVVAGRGEEEQEWMKLFGGEGKCKIPPFHAVMFIVLFDGIKPSCKAFHILC